MSYIVNYTDSTIAPIVVDDQSLNNSTTITFVGKQQEGYSTAVAESFLHLLENSANSTAPNNPVTGELWYDTGIEPKQLKIWNGIKWTEASNVKKDLTTPTSDSSVVGDLWVDAAKQQLYLFNGAAWILVGPQFDEASATGVRSEILIDRDTNEDRSILSFYVNDSPVLIISTIEFYPKSPIAGFDKIRSGVSLTSKDFNFNGINDNKFWGTSEKSESLVVGNVAVPGANFLRSDQVSTTNFTLNIRNNGGLVLGASLDSSITAGSSGTVIYNRRQNSPVIIRNTDSLGAIHDVLTITGTRGVGINKSPTESLDVSGNILTDGVIKTTSTNASTSPITGSLIVSGGAGISGDLNVAGNTSFIGTLEVGSTSANDISILYPKTNNSLNIGSTEKRFKNIYANTIFGNLIGSVTGNVSGNVLGSATRLSNTATFSIRGDVTSNVVPFNGASQVGNIIQISSVSRGATGIANIITATPHGFVNDYMVTINCAITSFNTTGSTIVITGPNSFTYLNAGVTFAATNTTGTVSVNPGGSFVTTIGPGIIADKPVLNDSIDSDFFLVYRATSNPPLRKMTKSTLFSSTGLTPIGTVTMFAGDVPPQGYLFCDGSEQSSTLYPELFSVLGYKYKPRAQLTGIQTFALPDIRGRVGVGRENMDNGNTVNIQVSATDVRRNATVVGAIQAIFIVDNDDITNGPFLTGRALTGTGFDTTSGQVVITNVVTTSSTTTITASIPVQVTPYPLANNLTITSIKTLDAGGASPATGRNPNATVLGNVGGNRQQSLTLNQIPDHEHTLKGSAGTQYYAINDLNVTPPDAGGFLAQGPNQSRDAQYLPSSGGVKGTSFGQPFDVLNPYLTLNYIIFTGRTF